MKKSLLILILSVILLISIIGLEFSEAERGSGRQRISEEVRIKDVSGNIKEIRIEREENNGEIRERFRVKESEFEAESEVEIETEGEEIRARLRNGRWEIIKILPDEVATLSGGEFGSEEVKIELKEEDGELVYEVETEKEGKLFGLFRKKVKVKGKIDPETGELLEKRKPWWAAFVSGEEADQFGSKVIVCHIPPGDPDAKHTINVGGPAVRAHLAHGDELGECAGGGGNQTQQNLTLTIMSPQNTIYVNATILVEINSNGDFVSFGINNGTHEIYTGAIERIFPEGNNTLDAYANNTQGQELTRSVSFVVVLESNNTQGNQSNNSL